MPRIRLLPLLAAMLLVLAGAASAHAGQYTLTYDFAGDLPEARAGTALWRAPTNAAMPP